MAFPIDTISKFTCCCGARTFGHMCSETDSERVNHNNANQVTYVLEKKSKVVRKRRRKRRRKKEEKKEKRRKRRGKIRRKEEDNDKDNDKDRKGKKK